METIEVGGGEKITKVSEAGLRVSLSSSQVDWSHLPSDTGSDSSKLAPSSNVHGHHLSFCERSCVLGRPPAQSQDEGIWERACFSRVAKGAAP